MDKKRINEIVSDCQAVADLGMQVLKKLEPALIDTTVKIAIDNFGTPEHNKQEYVDAVVKQLFFVNNAISMVEEAHTLISKIKI